MTAAVAADVVLLPLGSMEAHGPHLPPDTDTLIAQRLATRCARRLEAQKVRATVAPVIDETASAFAADFEGTVSTPPAEERRRIVEAVREHLGAGTPRVVLVNVHFDPEHMKAVRQAVAAVGDARVVFPDFTRRANAERIGGEFATGSCHAGRFETSLVLAAAPDRVDPAYKELPPLEVDLAAAIRQGKGSFAELGMDRAYCGWPAEASADEGRRHFEVLTDIVVDACLRALNRRPA
jgi:creatinine amidohydrolase